MTHPRITLSPRLPRTLGGKRIKVKLTGEEWETYRAKCRVRAGGYIIRTAACGLKCRCDAIATPVKARP